MKSILIVIVSVLISAIPVTFNYQDMSEERCEHENVTITDNCEHCGTCDGVCEDCRESLVDQGVGEGWEIA